MYTYLYVINFINCYKYIIIKLDLAYTYQLTSQVLPLDLSNSMQIDSTVRKLCLKKHTKHIVQVAIATKAFSFFSLDQSISIQTLTS